MITFPHAKINLGLHVTGKWDCGAISPVVSPANKHMVTAGKNSDTASPPSFQGYHTIESILLPVKLCDILEVTPAQDAQTRIFTSGLPIDEDPGQNLCMKAYRLLADAIGGLPPVAIYLHKVIPPGAGLGGGSADAAFMLRLLDGYFNLDLEPGLLQRLAIRLGSDCPFFLQNKPRLATGTGHILEEISLDQLNDKHLVIVVPPIHISTAWAYKQVNIRKTAKRTPKLLVREPMTTWQGQLQNDFEPLASKTYPILKHIKQSLQNAGAVYASLTGTGSGVYGIFSRRPSVADMQQNFPDCHVFHTEPTVC